MCGSKKFRLAAFFDTETTTLGEGSECVAFPILYIANDIRRCGIERYQIGNGVVSMWRDSASFIDFLEDIVNWGMHLGIVPIVAAYNLSFDMHSLLAPLSDLYEMEVLAQSNTSFYTLDLVLNGEKVLRFWDMFHLEMGGVEALGRTCGVSKAMGSWDYELIRGKDTPLTFEEFDYAARDTEVLAAYCAWLLRANPHLKLDDLGFRCLTKTSIVRLLGARTVGKLKIQDGSKSSVFNNFRLLCRNEKPTDFYTYAMRKNAFRGGYTFTAGALASRIWNNVASFDVVSMHHAFINGREVSTKFDEVKDGDVQELITDHILSRSLVDVLENYARPFDWAITAVYRFKNLRLRRGSVFERTGTALLPQSRFAPEPLFSDIGAVADSRTAETNNVYREYLGDTHKGGVFAFGKLISAKRARVNLTELELWNIRQVYEWDSLECLKMEATASFQLPPEFVSLLSNMLFEQKQAMKTVLATYSEGVEYSGAARLELLPEQIASDIRAGSADKGFLEAYYGSTVKGAFNSIYGMMAQDVYKPDFAVKDGEIMRLKETLPSPANFEKRTPKNLKVLYTYGTRIVGGSRMHLIIAMLLIDKAFGDRVKILGGDTDSLKIALGGAEIGDILEALEPLHKATDKAITSSQARIRERYPTYAADFESLGHFEYEGTTYSHHVELWNKARVSYDGEFHVTLAGVPRPRNTINIEVALARLADKTSVEYVLESGIGYNTTLSPAVSHFLGVARPKVGARFEGDFTDYRGEAQHVEEFRAIGLYPSSKAFGEQDVPLNKDNLTYLRSVALYPDLAEKRYRYNKGRLYFSHGMSEIEI